MFGYESSSLGLIRDISSDALHGKLAKISALTPLELGETSLLRSCTARPGRLETYSLAEGSGHLQSQRTLH